MMKCLFSAHPIIQIAFFLFFYKVITTDHHSKTYKIGLHPEPTTNAFIALESIMFRAVECCVNATSNGWDEAMFSAVTNCFRFPSHTHHKQSRTVFALFFLMEFLIRHSPEHQHHHHQHRQCETNKQKCTEMKEDSGKKMRVTCFTSDHGCFFLVLYLDLIWIYFKIIIFLQIFVFLTFREIVCSILFTICQAITINSKATIFNNILQI